MLPTPVITLSVLRSQKKYDFEPQVYSRIQIQGHSEKCRSFQRLPIVGTFMRHFRRDDLRGTFFYNSSVDVGASPYDVCIGVLEDELSTTVNAQ